MPLLESMLLSIYIYIYIILYTCIIYIILYNGINSGQLAKKSLSDNMSVIKGPHEGKASE